MDGTDTLFRALAEPLRRQVLEQLLDGEKTVSELCHHFSVSQPAVSQHLKVLRDAGLVRERYEGRFRIYGVELESLLPAARWLAPYQSAWHKRLKSVGRILRRARQARDQG
ncbi:MAG: metalloregulator ArsR/SmtB family transcription factor [Burkholderiaceae bacterium]|jgi:DNA-binding transcriptional ArsR family regulator